MKLHFYFQKFTFGGLYSCIYLIPTILILWNKLPEKISYHNRGFYIEFRFLNLNYSFVISFERIIK